MPLETDLGVTLPAETQGRTAKSVQQLRSFPNGDGNAQSSAHKCSQQEKPSQRYSSPTLCLKHGTGLQIREEQEIICKTKGCGSLTPSHVSTPPIQPHCRRVSDELLPAGRLEMQLGKMRLGAGEAGMCHSGDPGSESFWVTGKRVACQIPKTTMKLRKGRENILNRARWL